MITILTTLCVPLIARNQRSCRQCRQQTFPVLALADSLNSRPLTGESGGEARENTLPGNGPEYLQRTTLAAGNLLLARGRALIQQPGKASRELLERGLIQKMQTDPDSLDPEREWVHRHVQPSDFKIERGPIGLRQSQKRRRGMMRGWFNNGFGGEKKTTKQKHDPH